MNNKILIIIGMHRSGTSLTSSWLNSMGLYLGGNLVGKGIGNLKGHFEDYDFYNLHNDILTHNKLMYYVGINDVINVTKGDKNRAKKLLDKKNIKSQWGWKEPRTCLFLNSIYKELIPNAKNLIVFRDYNEVVDSLYRREKKWFNQKNKVQKLYNNYLKKSIPKQNKLNSYLEAWVRYNTEIINYFENGDVKNFIFIDNSAIVDLNEKIFSVLTKNWNFDLSYVDIKNVYEESSITTNISPLPFSEELKTKADNIQIKLKKYAHESLNNFFN